MMARHRDGFMNESSGPPSCSTTRKVDANLVGYVGWVDGEIAKLRGAPPPPQQDATVALIADDADLTSLPLLVIEGGNVSAREPDQR